MTTRGDIFLANFDTVLGSEQGGTRPCVIISNNVGNQFSPCVTVALITSKVESKPNLPTHLELNAGNFGLAKKSIVLCEQIRTIDKMRLIQKLGSLDFLTLSALNWTLTQALAL